MFNNFKHFDVNSSKRGDGEVSTLGFPVRLKNFPLLPAIGNDNHEILDINMDHLEEQVFTILIFKPVKFTGAEVKFIRTHLGFNHESFVELINNMIIERDVSNTRNLFSMDNDEYKDFIEESFTVQNLEEIETSKENLLLDSEEDALRHIMLSNSVAKSSIKEEDFISFLDQVKESYGGEEDKDREETFQEKNSYILTICSHESEYRGLWIDKNTHKEVKETISKMEKGIENQDATYACSLSNIDVIEIYRHFGKNGYNITIKEGDISLDQSDIKARPYLEISRYNSHFERGINTYNYILTRLAYREETTLTIMTGISIFVLISLFLGNIEYHPMVAVMLCAFTYFLLYMKSLTVTGENPRYFYD